MLNCRYTLNYTELDSELYTDRPVYRTVQRAARYKHHPKCMYAERYTERLLKRKQNFIFSCRQNCTMYTELYTDLCIVLYTELFTDLYTEQCFEQHM